MEAEASDSTFYKIALVLEYEGTRYAGFQVQPHRRTIQGELEQALGRLTREAVRVHAASRTDAGAHAWGQVVAFRTGARRSLDAFVRGTNSYLPSDIRVQAAYQVADAFDPRRDAYAREYHYRLLLSPAPSALLARYAYHVPRPLDLAAMREAAQLLPGVRDFAPFAGRPEKGGTIRRMDRLDVQEKGALATLEMEGNAFLPQQVRRVAGALVQVGLGRLSVGDFQALRDSPRSGIGGPALPAAGLYLVKVTYADFPP